MFASRGASATPKVDEQPTGATTTGSGVKADQAIPAAPRVLAADIPLGNHAPPSAQPSNTWTQQGPTNVQGSPPDPWVKSLRDPIPVPSADSAAMLGQMLAHVGRMDALFTRLRACLEPKPWSTISAGGMGTGLGMGTIGAGTIYPTACLLEGVHNATSTSVTFGVSDTGSADPIPKFSCTVPAGITIPVGTRGLLFQHGISLVAMTPGGTLTFFGSDVAP